MKIQLSLSRTILTLACASCLSLSLAAQESSPPFTVEASRWADSLIRQMNDTALLGQLIMLRAHSDLGKKHEDEVAGRVRKYQLGGLCFFQGGPGRQLNLINRYQALSDIPLFIAQDAEWGLGMRLDSTLSFPRQQALGALRDNDLVFDMGKEIGRQLRRIGVHINFAPVVDVNNNAGNPVINSRSFGENRYLVTAKAYQYMMGLQSSGVLACAKHFPGHGDTEVDSHEGLPVISQKRSRLDSLELYPFRQLSGEGMPSVMVAHLQVPALDPREGQPTTLSRKVIHDLLRVKMGYPGLIFTDAMDMGGVTRMRASGLAEAEALAAGNDMVLLPLELERTMDTLFAWLEAGRLDRAELEASARRVLMAKYRIGLQEFKPLTAAGLHDDLHPRGANRLKEDLFAASLTLIRDEAGRVPLHTPGFKNPLLINLGGNPGSAFSKRWKELAPAFEELTFSRRNPVRGAMRKVRGKKPDFVLITLRGLRQVPKDRYGLSENTLEIVQALQAEYPSVLVLMGNPYVAAYLDETPTLLCTYQDDEVAQRVAAEALFGSRGISGRLPVTVSPKAPAGSGLLVYPEKGEQP